MPNDAAIPSDSVGVDTAATESGGLTVFFRDKILITALLVLWALVALDTGGAFLSSRNLANLFRQISVLGILAAGMQYVLITGHIDLCGGVVAGFVSLFVSSAQVLLLSGRFPGTGGATAAASIPPGTVITVITATAGILFGVLFGMYQGWLIGRAGLPSIVVSFGNMFLLTGLIPLATMGVTPTNIDASLLYLGQGYLPPWIGAGISGLACFVFGWVRIRMRKRRMDYGLEPESVTRTILAIAAVFAIVFGFFLYVGEGYRGFPVPVLVLAGTTMLLHYLLIGTRFGQRCVAIGYSRTVTRFSGINVNRHILSAYALSGGTAALAGIVLTGYTSFGVFSEPSSLSFTGLAACLVGLIGFRRDHGAVIGAVFGALLLGTIENWMVFADAAPFVKSLIQGLILITVAFLAARKGVRLPFSLKPAP